ncbi:hypothetical protein N0V83_002727 [Neocucurbitaria cava]|uniref:Uncharacterized protein n=1 Tax=Neocucurbitaria cava TaxID=798079 RepID=A0A9W8YE80_9PLEO|nr:hypothetical protein N0V83_002727 [Neocucurbitaria cava]
MSVYVPLPPFSKAVTQEAVEAETESMSPTGIINHILTLSTYMLNLVEHGNFFGKPKNDPFSASLRTFYDRLHNGQFGLSSLPPQFLDEERIMARSLERTKAPAALRPLADFEDLYYALIGRMKDIHHLLNMRLKSGFNEMAADLFEEGPTMTSLHDSLSKYWDILNDPSCGKALDDAIRMEKAEAMHEEILFRVQNHELSPAEGEEDVARLWDHEVYNGIQGLWYINGFAPAMIAATLEEKYRVVFRLEKEAHKRKMEEEQQAEMQMIMDARNSTQQETTNQRNPEVHMSTQQVDKKPRVASNHPVQLAPQQYKVVDEHLHQNPEQERAQQEKLRSDLEWQMKTQRVAEYRDYLRSRASPDAKYIMELAARNSQMMRK